MRAGVHKINGYRGHTIPEDLDVVAERTSLAIDLDAVVQDLLERRAVEDTVVRRTGVVNDELVLSSSLSSGSGLGLAHRREKRGKTQD